MRVLGISAFYHDSAAALVEDDHIVGAAQEERFTRKKHDSSFPKNAIAYCLEEAGAKLDAPWTLGELARRVHLSDEHLRRLCLRELGRSPMQHLTYMRMQRAQALLEISDDKLEVIAPQVGYDSALVFSRAFKRWIGMIPSDYRGSRISA